MKSYNFFLIISNYGRISLLLRKRGLGEINDKNMQMVLLLPDKVLCG